MAIHGSQLADSSVTTAKLSIGGTPATQAYVDAQVQQAIFNQDWKASCRVASTANVSLSAAPSAVDGVTLTAGDRLLLKNQTAGAENGIWVFSAAGSALVRANDADSSTELTSQMAVSIEQGAANTKTTWRLTNTGAITVGTTALVFENFATISNVSLSTANKAMTASVTTANGDVACATALVSTPAQGGYVMADVNGLLVNVGNAVKTTECYFSGDSGATARAYNGILAGDKLYWNGSIAGYQLAASFTVGFHVVA